MFDDFKEYSELLLKIVSKDSTLLPFVHNSYQKKLTHIALERIKEGRPIRIIGLKCRQIGFSTWAAAFIYHQAVTNLYKRGFIIADDADNTNNLFNMCKRFWDFSPENARPMKRYSNEKALVFENPNEKERDENPGLLSSIHVGTAGKLTSGRSGTLSLVHCSEFAFWPNASVVVSGLFQAVPYKPNTAIIIETTANGVSGRGEEFYNRWKAAESGESEFTPVFFKWTDNPEYEIEVGPEFELTDYEKDLQDRHPDLTVPKVAFRRYKIENEMGSSLIAPEDQFRQEYPLSSDEAFISSGRPVFDQESLLDDIERAKSVKFHLGDIDGNGRFYVSKKGRYKIYHHPYQSSQYTIGADVAEGLETGDFSSMFVMGKDLTQVASFHAHIAPDIFGKEMCRIGRYFNNALLAPEVNNHGHATLSKIKDLNYPKIYHRPVNEQRVESKTKKLGWQTTSKTKTKMLDEFVAAYRDRSITINDIDLLKEMVSLTIEADGNVNLNGKDRVVAACIALQSVKQLGYGRTGVLNPQKVPDRVPRKLQDRLKHYEKKRKYGN